MNYHWLSLFCATCSILIFAGGESSSKHSSSESNSAPETVLEPAGDPLQDRDLSESELASAPDLVLPDNSANVSLDYDEAESESMPEPELKPNVHGPLEDLYIKYYGNNPWIERCWTPIRDMQMDEDEEKMKLVCIEYHKIARKGSLKADQILVDMNKQLLKFRTKDVYRSTHVDVLWYGVNDTKAREIEDMHHFYITKGMGIDCVFYLTPTDKTAMEFYLEEHICKNSATALMWMKKTKEEDEKSRGKGKKGKKANSEDIEELEVISVENEIKSKKNKIASEADEDAAKTMAKSKKKTGDGNVEKNTTEKASKFKKKKDEKRKATNESAVPEEVRKPQVSKRANKNETRRINKSKHAGNGQSELEAKREPGKPKSKTEKNDLPVLNVNTTVNNTEASSGNFEKIMVVNESRRKAGKPSLNKNT